VSAQLIGELKAEPNLTPLLDVVFQLITFFMLMVNFSSDNYDRRITLPVAGSARPVEDDKQVGEDRLVLNIDKEGHLLMGGEVQDVYQAERSIQHQAKLIKLNLEAAGRKLDATGSLPTTIVLRADRDTSFSSLFRLIKACQSSGFRKFALKAMNG
jgi:biopolymer transport protein ExbD